MDGKNEFVKKKINKNIIFTILFYLIIFSTLLIGILKFNCTTDGNFNFEIKKCIDFSKGIGIYNKYLINFNSKSSELFTEKNCINGVYYFRIIYYVISLICLIYLPIFITELKNRFYNKNNLVLTEDELYGTRTILFKTIDFKIKLKDLKQIIIKKNIFRFFCGKEKLILVTDNQIIKIYFIKDINKVYDKIDNLAKQKNAIYDFASYKNLKKNTFKRIGLDIKNVFSRMSNFFNINELFNNKSDLEIKLEKIKKLKNSNEITDEEYIQLREKIINDNIK